MTFITVVVALLFAQQGAPADVPKTHWAHPAVDSLFNEGLLKGYPTQKAVTLDKTAKVSEKEGEALIEKWKKMELLGGFGDWHRRYSPPSRYEVAVAAHASWANLLSTIKEGKVSQEKIDLFLSEVPKLAYVISAFDFELTKLGGDTKDMIAKLNDLTEGPYRPFRG